MTTKINITKRLNALLSVLLLFGLQLANGQTEHSVHLNKEYKDIHLTGKSNLTYTLPLAKDGIYQFSILQQGIAVNCTLTSSDNKKLYESDSPNDINGYRRFEYCPTGSGNFTLHINRFEHPANPDSGQISILVKSLTKGEIAIRSKIKKELEPENAKNVTTIDIDHFWSAFDNLKNCRTFSDSVNSIQKLYLDKATNGLLDFIQVRDFTAEKFVNVISKNVGLYESVRKNTYEAKKAEPVIEEVFAAFKELYADFKPFKVCFAIGINNTGGTVSNKYVLIGTEVTIKTAGADDIIQKIKSMVAHECVHTQQKPLADSHAIKCPLLYQSIHEGACDFIGELITKTPQKNEYGEKNEKKLWTEFKNELCNEKLSNWLYNGFSAKDRPGDLGYFIGYEISKEYYKNATDKKQAIIDIIGMQDPIQFLILSRYDQKFKQ
jgi:hypothetical protein